MKLSEIQRTLAREIIRGNAPETALGKELVEVVHTTVLRGGGESTTWHGFFTVRLNEKQIWRGTDHEYAQTTLPAILNLGRDPVLFSKGRKSMLFFLP